MKRRTVILGASAALAGALGAGGLVGYRLVQRGQDLRIDPGRLFEKNPKVNFSRLSNDTLTKILAGRLTDHDRRAVARELIRHNRRLYAPDIHLIEVLRKLILEATLRQTHVNWHLSAFEAFDGYARTGLLAFLATARRLT